MRMEQVIESVKDVFSTVNHFRIEVDYSQSGKLTGEVFDAEESHGQAVASLIPRRLPTGKKMVDLVFVRPLDPSMPTGDFARLAMSRGLLPAIQIETVTSLKTAKQDKIDALFQQVDEVLARRDRAAGTFIGTRLNVRVVGSLSVACLGSIVCGTTNSSNLIVIHEVIRHSGQRLIRLHLQRYNPKKPLPPAQTVPFVLK